MNETMAGIVKAMRRTGTDCEMWTDSACEEVARAVLEAVRTPTVKIMFPTIEGMIRHSDSFHPGAASWEGCTRAIGDIWAGLIDEILK